MRHAELQRLALAAPRRRVAARGRRDEGVALREPVVRQVDVGDGLVEALDEVRDAARALVADPVPRQRQLRDPDERRHVQERAGDGDGAVVAQRVVVEVDGHGQGLAETGRALADLDGDRQRDGDGVLVAERRRLADEAEHDAAGAVGRQQLAAPRRHARPRRRARVRARRRRRRVARGPPRRRRRVVLRVPEPRRRVLVQEAAHVDRRRDAGGLGADVALARALLREADAAPQALRGVREAPPRVADGVALQVQPERPAPAPRVAADGVDGVDRLEERRDAAVRDAVVAQVELLHGLELGLQQLREGRRAAVADAVLVEPQVAHVGDVAERRERVDEAADAVVRDVAALEVQAQLEERARRRQARRLPLPRDLLDDALGQVRQLVVPERRVELRDAEPELRAVAPEQGPVRVRPGEARAGGVAPGVGAAGGRRLRRGAPRQRRERVAPPRGVEDSARAAARHGRVPAEAHLADGVLRLLQQLRDAQGALVGDAVVVEEEALDLRDARRQE